MTTVGHVIFVTNFPTIKVAPKQVQVATNFENQKLNTIHLFLFLLCLFYSKLDCSLDFIGL